MLYCGCFYSILLQFTVVIDNNIVTNTFMSNAVNKCICILPPYIFNNVTDFHRVFKVFTTTVAAASTACGCGGSPNM